MRSRTDQTTTPGKEQHEPEGAHLGPPRTPHAKRRWARWSARRKRDSWAVLVVLLLGIGTVIILSAQPGTAPGGGMPTSTTGGAPVPAATVTVRPAQVRIYPFPGSNAGLMQPAVDMRGTVWVGEMYANRFARLDSHTGVITTWVPPNAKNGLMTTTIDVQGNAWFVEQGANYIGRFDPRQHTFRTFPLGTVHGRQMAPQDLQFDPSGKLWFTAAGGGRIGRLDPATGAIQMWPVPAPRAGIPALPFSLTVLPNGQIWFGYLTGGAVGHLDAATGRVTLYHLADPQATVFSIAHDAKGRIWFTEIIPGKLGMIDSASGRVTELPVPALSGNLAALYRLVVANDGEVWFVDNGANALVRYTPGKATYTFFQLPASSGGGLYGLTRDGAGRLWFSTSGTSTNAIGEVSP